MNNDLRCEVLGVFGFRSFSISYHYNRVMFERSDRFYFACGSFNPLIPGLSGWTKVAKTKIDICLCSVEMGFYLLVSRAFPVSNTPLVLPMRVLCIELTKSYIHTLAFMVITQPFQSAPPPPNRSLTPPVIPLPSSPWILPFSCKP